jgi:hypothetical protein
MHPSQCKPRQRTILANKQGNAFVCDAGTAEVERKQPWQLAKVGWAFLARPRSEPRSTPTA